MKQFKCISMIILLSAILSGCRTEDCSKDLCFDRGVCVEGECFCDQGYEGIDCLTNVNKKFQGNYSVTDSAEVCGTGIFGGWNTTVSISTADPDRIFFDNLYNSGIHVAALVGQNGTDFLINDEEFGNTTISGNGSINSNFDIIVITYTIGQISDVCTNVVMTRY